MTELLPTRQASDLRRAITDYITTAISYPNGAPHIGHAYEVITTDVIARYKRLDGYDVRFLTGVDDHGQKMVQTAKARDMTAQELADDPSPEEAADLLICLVGICLSHGWTVGDLADAVEAKVVVNAARRWSQQPDGTWQHVPDLPPAEETR